MTVMREEAAPFDFKIILFLSNREQEKKPSSELNQL